MAFFEISSKIFLVLSVQITNGNRTVSSQSPIKLIQALNAFSQMAWFYTQIKRMGDGNEPNLELKIFKAWAVLATTLL